MKAPGHIISHPTELEALSVLPIKRTPGQKLVGISERLIRSPQRESLEHELNRRLFACGCPEATIGLLLAFVGYVGWALTIGSDIGMLRHVSGGFAAACAGALIGKLVGLLAAERRLKQIVAEVRSAIPPDAMKHPNSPAERLLCY